MDGSTTTTTSKPSTTNYWATLINSITNAALSGGEAAVELYITTQFPILANPILQDILDMIVKDIGNDLGTQANILVDYMIFDFQTNGENSKVYQSMASLQTALKTGDVNAIATATQNAKNSWAGLIHYDGSANPNP